MPPPEALIVDDDSDSRLALSELLRAHGYTVREAENGKVALHMIAERLPSVLLLDLEMPVMNGWDVMAFLARVGATDEIPIVVLSAGASAPPGVPFVRKPCRADVLVEMIDRSVKGEHRSSASEPARPS